MPNFYKTNPILTCDSERLQFWGYWLDIATEYSEGHGCIPSPFDAKRIIDVPYDLRYILKKLYGSTRFEGTDLGHMLSNPKPDQWDYIASQALEDSYYVGPIYELFHLLRKRGYYWEMGAHILFGTYKNVQHTPPAPMTDEILSLLLEAPMSLDEFRRIIGPKWFDQLKALRSIGHLVHVRGYRRLNKRIEAEIYLA